MVINSTAGIMFELAIVENKLSIGNILFYIWLVLSFVILIKILWKWWKEPLHFEH